MTGGAAFCVLAADIGQTADIHTLVADTGPISGTVGVADTFKWNTADTGIALGSGRA